MLSTKKSVLKTIYIFLTTIMSSVEKFFLSSLHFRELKICDGLDFGSAKTVDLQARGSKQNKSRDSKRDTIMPVTAEL